MAERDQKQRWSGVTTHVAEEYQPWVEEEQMAHAGQAPAEGPEREEATGWGTGS